MFSSTAPRRPSISSLPSSKFAFLPLRINNISGKGKSQRLTYVSDRLPCMIPNPLFATLPYAVIVEDPGCLSGIPDPVLQHCAQYPYMFVQIFLLLILNSSSCSSFSPARLMNYLNMYLFTNRTCKNIAGVEARVYQEIREPYSS
jgi:hypothetical protein